MKFTTYTMADISTTHITPQDGALMDETDIPCHIAKINDNVGDIFAVPSPDGFQEWVPLWRDRGFSEAFINIMQILSAQGIAYARFDQAGDEVAGLPTFDWPPPSL